MPKKKGKEKKNKNLTLLIVLAVLLIFIDAISYLAYINIKNPLGNSHDSGEVSSIIDGDTFSLEDGNYVRMIGINAPEAGQPYYEDSARMLEFLIKGKKVRLEKDARDRDSYGRLLRYVYVDYNKDEIFVNLESVRLGYSLPLSIPPDTKYSSLIESAHQECLLSKVLLCS